MGFFSTILALLGTDSTPAPPARQDLAAGPAADADVPAPPAAPSPIGELRGNPGGLVLEITDSPDRTERFIRIMRNGCGLVLAGGAGAVVLALFLAFGLRAVFHGVHIPWPHLAVFGGYAGGATVTVLAGAGVRALVRRLRRRLSGIGVSDPDGSANGQGSGQASPDGPP